MVMVQAKEAEVCRVMEELKAAAAARRKAILATAESAVEEVEMEQAIRLQVKQKGCEEGEQLACNCCATWRFDCQVSGMFLMG